MSKVCEPEAEQMLPEYDFSKGVRGKYARRYQASHSVIVVDDATRTFPNIEIVHQELRMLAQLARQKVNIKST